MALDKLEIFNESLENTRNELEQLNNFVSYKAVYCEDNHRCHALFDIPEGYDSVRCDLCAKKELQDLGKQFYHCFECEFDVCSECMVKTN